MTLSKGALRARLEREQEIGGEDIAAVFRSAAAERLYAIGAVRAEAWPDPSWQRDPVGFARTILGVQPWEKQVEIFVACRDNLRVAVRSNNKAGKSTGLAMLALWFVYSFPQARALLMADTEKQVGGAVYHEIVRLFSGSGRCIRCKKDDPNGPRPCAHSRVLDGVIREDPGSMSRTGLKFHDGRQIVSLSGKDAESVAGYSSPNLVIIFDEASGTNFDRVYEGVVGNMAGDGHLWIISNPTRSSGVFYEIFHGRSSVYKTIHVSAYDSPNVKAGKNLIPGLATRGFIEAAREEFGERSPFFRARVLGEFPIVEKGQIFPADVIEMAIGRHEETEASGSVFVVAIDVAGDTGVGDESVFVARRGKRILDMLAKRGLSAEAHLVEALGLVAKHRQNGDEVRVVVDREGEPGFKVFGVFSGYLAAHEDAFRLVGVRASERAQRNPKNFDRVRDELGAVLADWIRDGGALPDDPKLAAELSVMRWIENVFGRAKLLPKDKLRDLLGRSPDRYDALALSVWGEHRHEEAPPPPTAAQAQHQEAMTSEDPRDWIGPDGFDPYALLEEATGRR